MLVYQVFVGNIRTTKSNSLLLIFAISKGVEHEARGAFLLFLVVLPLQPQAPDARFRSKGRGMAPTTARTSKSHRLPPRRLAGKACAAVRL